MISHARHLEDERLFECYLAEHHGEPMDLPAAEHLADCEPCESRYAEMATFLEALRREGEADADAIFTPERMRAPAAADCAPARARRTPRPRPQLP